LLYIYKAVQTIVPQIRDLLLGAKLISGASNSRPVDQFLRNFRMQLQSHPML
jgi:hypothetical protein